VKEPVHSVERGFLAHLLLDNYPLKLISIVFSVALFSVVHNGEDAQRSVYLDVVALLPPPTADSVLVSTLPARVKVTLRGSRSRISALSHDDFAPVHMDLREPGRQYYYFDPSDIGVTGSLHVVSIEPGNVPLVWRPRAERTVTILPNLSGTPATGYVVRPPVQIAPTNVTISGPRDEVEAISSWTTEQISVDGLGPGVVERRVRLEPLTGHLTYMGQSVVAVRIEVDPDTAERTFSGLDVEAVGPGNVKLRPKAVQVTLRGPAPQLAKLSGEQLVPFVEPSTVPASGVESAVVKLGGLPEFCSIVRIVPSSVLVKHER